jgi:endonuclease/exonuclease/phosphatase family metal-dependent hydrolase
MATTTWKFVFVLMVVCISHSSGWTQRLQVMSYNIHHGADRDEVGTLDSMGSFIKKLKPTLVGLQEVDSVCTRSGKVDQMKRLAKITGMHYAFVRHFPYQGGAYGVGVLSKYPIVQTESKTLKLLKPGANGQSVSMIFCTVRISRKKEIVFATAHYSAFDKATRVFQVEETLRYLESEHRPVIFTGDLNATPETEEIQKLLQRLQSVDSSSLPTFPETQPSKTIDYILVSPQHLKGVKKVVTPEVRYSDHLPLMATIDLK